MTPIPKKIQKFTTKNLKVIIIFFLIQGSLKKNGLSPKGREAGVIIFKASLKLDDPLKSQFFFVGGLHKSIELNPGD